MYGENWLEVKFEGKDFEINLNNVEYTKETGSEVTVHFVSGGELKVSRDAWETGWKAIDPEPGVR